MKKVIYLFSFLLFFNALQAQEKVFDFKDVKQALSCMRDNEHFGKLILKL